LLKEKIMRGRLEARLGVLEARRDVLRRRKAELDRQIGLRTGKERDLTATITSLRKVRTETERRKGELTRNLTARRGEVARTEELLREYSGILSQLEGMGLIREAG
jgi:chromosome segregation ATPase